MGRIVSKANALGKAKGYADRDTMTWNVELPIAIYMPKAVQRYRMEWEHDIVSKYWQMSGKDRWSFATKEGAKLTKHSDTAIKGHIKVQGNRSPYDGDWVYWGSRMGKHPEIPTRITKLLKEQQGKCNQCGLIFKLDDLIEIDRIIPGKEGGKYTYGNTQLLHRHCHDNKTREDAHKYLVGTKELEEYFDENPF